MPKTAKKKVARQANPYPKPRKANGPMKAAPAAMSRTIVSTAPNISRRKDGVTIRHKEFFYTVGTFGTAGDFLVDALSINPGNPQMFPWLASQASGWERYRFKSLRFMYVPRCATAQQGTLVLSPDYDAADEAPTGEAMACSYADAVSCVPWMETELRLRREPLAGGMTSKYVRSGALKSNLDIKSYDAGQLFICRDSANSSTVVWGKLWVEYEVEFLTPHTIPTPFTSTYAATVPNTGGPAGVPSAYPVPAATAAGATVETAGPINIAPGSLTTGGYSDTYNISGLITGAQYLLQFLVEAGATSTYTATATGVVTGLTKIADTIAPPFAYNAAGSGFKSVVAEALYRATSSVATYKPVVNWVPGASGVTNAIGTQLILSPVVNDPAWTLL